MAWGKATPVKQSSLSTLAKNAVNRVQSNGYGATYGAIPQSVSGRSKTYYGAKTSPKTSKPQTSAYDNYLSGVLNANYGNGSTPSASSMTRLNNSNFSGGGASYYGQGQGPNRTSGNKSAVTMTGPVGGFGGYGGGSSSGYANGSDILNGGATGNYDLIAQLMDENKAGRAAAANTERSLYKDLLAKANALPGYDKTQANTDMMEGLSAEQSGLERQARAAAGNLYGGAYNPAMQENINRETINARTRGTADINEAQRQAGLEKMDMLSQLTQLLGGVERNYAPTDDPQAMLPFLDIIAQGASENAIAGDRNSVVSPSSNSGRGAFLANTRGEKSAFGGGKLMAEGLKRKGSTQADYTRYGGLGRLSGSAGMFGR